MPVSEVKKLVIETPTRRYSLLVMKFGGQETFFVEKGFGDYGYVAGIILGPNASVLTERIGGDAVYSLEKAGFVHVEDFAVGWRHTLLHYDLLEDASVIRVIYDERSGTYKVKEVTEMEVIST